MIEMNLLRPRAMAEVAGNRLLTLYDREGQLRAFLVVRFSHLFRETAARRKVGNWAKV